MTTYQSGHPCLGGEKKNQKTGPLDFPLFGLTQFWPSEQTLQKDIQIKCTYLRCCFSSSMFTALQQEITVKTTSVCLCQCKAGVMQWWFKSNISTCSKCINTQIFYIYTHLHRKKSTLKLVRMFGHVAENRSVWVEFTKTNSNGWNVDTHLMV